MRLAIFLALLCVAYAHVTTADKDDNDLLGRVQSSHQELQAYSRTDACMRRAVDSLTRRCHEQHALDEEERARVALALANCHLRRSHKATVECGQSTDGEATGDFGACTAALTGDAWNTYTTFYAHADNVCFYYATLKWRAQKDELLARMHATGEAVAQRVAEGAALAAEIVRAQREVVAHVLETADVTRQTRRELETANAHVHALHAQVAGGVERLGAAITHGEERVHGAFERVFDAFERVLRVQAWVVAHFDAYASVLSYAGFSLGVLLVTAVPQVARARGAALLCLWISYALERSVAVFTTQYYHHHHHHHHQNTDHIMAFQHGATSIIRYSATAATVYLLYAAYSTYTDAHAHVLQSVKDLKNDVSRVLSPTVHKNRVKNALLSILKEAQRVRRERHLCERK